MSEFLSFKEKDKLFDLEFLKKNCLEIHAFGLGFIQIKLSFHHRLHIYCPDVKVTSGEEEVHDHRYDFKSEILRGEIENLIYDINEGDTHLIHFENCRPEKLEKTKEPRPCTLKFSHSFLLKEGSSYVLDKDLLHKVRAKYAITFLTRKNPEKDLARVIQKKEEELICPFSVNLPESELWRLVERELKR